MYQNLSLPPPQAGPRSMLPFGFTESPPRGGSGSVRTMSSSTIRTNRIASSGGTSGEGTSNGVTNNTAECSYSSRTNVNCTIDNCRSKARTCCAKRPVITPCRKEIDRGSYSPSAPCPSRSGSRANTAQVVKSEDRDNYKRPSTSDIGAVKNKMLGTHLNEQSSTVATSYAGMSMSPFSESGFLRLPNRNKLNATPKPHTSSRSSSCCSNGSSKKLLNNDYGGDSGYCYPSSSLASPPLLLPDTSGATPKVGTRTIRSQVSRTPQCTPRGDPVTRGTGSIGESEVPQRSGADGRRMSRHASDASIDVPTLIFCPIEKMRQKHREKESLSDLHSNYKVGGTARGASVNPRHGSPTAGTKCVWSPSPDVLASLKSILKTKKNGRETMGSEKNDFRKRRPSSASKSAKHRKVHFDENSIAQARRERRIFKNQRAIGTDQNGKLSSEDEGERDGLSTVLHDDGLGLSWDHLDLEKLLEDDQENEESKNLLGHTVRFSKRSSKGVREMGVDDWGQDSDWFNEQFGVVKSTTQEPTKQEHGKFDDSNPCCPGSGSATLEPVEPTSTRSGMNSHHARSKLAPLPPPMTVDQLEARMEDVRPRNMRGNLGESGQEELRSNSVATSSCSTPPSSTHFSTAALSDIERGMLRALVRANWRNGRVWASSLGIPGDQTDELPPNADTQCQRSDGPSATTISTLPSPSAPMVPPQRRRSISWDVSFSNDTEPEVVDCEEIFPRKEVPKPMTS